MSMPDAWSKDSQYPPHIQQLSQCTSPTSQWPTLKDQNMRLFVLTMMFISHPICMQQYTRMKKNGDEINE